MVAGAFILTIDKNRFNFYVAFQVYLILFSTPPTYLAITEYDLPYLPSNDCTSL